MKLDEEEDEPQFGDDFFDNARKKRDDHEQKFTDSFDDEGGFLVWRNAAWGNEGQTEDAANWCVRTDDHGAKYVVATKLVDPSCKTGQYQLKIVYV